MSDSGQPSAEREVLEGGRLKGGVFRSHIRWIQDHHGEAGVKRVFESLSDEVSSALSSVILATSWYPFAWLIELDKAIGKIWAPRREKELIRDLGRYSATINLTTTYKAFSRDTNHEFFQNSAILHKQFQDFGDVTYEQTGDDSGKMIHRGYPCFSPIFCASALGYYEACLHSHGAVIVNVTEPLCQCRGDDSCTFELSWG